MRRGALGFARPGASPTRHAPGATGRNVVGNCEVSVHSHRYKANVQTVVVTAMASKLGCVFNRPKGIAEMTKPLARTAAMAVVMTTAMAWNLPVCARAPAPNRVPATAANASALAPASGRFGPRTAPVSKPPS